ncbi:hypothetical protein RJ639_005376, partial [Escallonia herrerae]
MASLFLNLSPRLPSSTSQILGQSLSSSSYPSLSLSSLSPPSFPSVIGLFKKADGAISTVVYCGRGDKKTTKGKRFNHSFRN